jgi:hypothetical protein
MLTYSTDVIQSSAEAIGCMWGGLLRIALECESYGENS